jgi:ABC-type oligopeptide transport system substrate-binding subunit
MNNRYLTRAAAYGGTYSEGLVGNVKAVNPLFPENSATQDVTSLVFSGLTRIDSKRQIEGNLASNWEVSADKKASLFIYGQILNGKMARHSQQMT